MQQQQFSDSLERDDRKEMVKRSTVGLTPPSQDGLLPFSYLLSGLSRNSFPRPTLIAGAHHFSFLFTSDVYVVNAGRQRTAVFYQENCSPYSSNSSVSHRMRNGPEDKKYIFWKRKKKVERWNLKERKGKKNILVASDRWISSRKRSSVARTTTTTPQSPLLAVALPRR